MPDRSVAPRFRKITSVDFPKATSIRSGNGIVIHYLEAGVQPVCKIEILFHSGKRFENKPGLSFLTFKMLSEGTKNLSTGQIAEMIDLTGSHLAIEPGVEFSSIQLLCLREKAEQLLSMLFELITLPEFPITELQKQKKIIKQSIAIELEKNNVVASRKFREQIFGNNHPHGYAANPDDIDKIEREEIIDFFNNKIKKNKIEIFVSGKADKPLLNIIQDQCNQLDYPALTKTDDERSVANSNHGRKHIPKESSNQTSIRIGKLAISKPHPDYLKLLVTNEILGGYFGSRLMQNIREDKGLTYGIYSMVVPIINDGYFVISADAKKELKDIVIEEIFKELNQLRSHPVDHEEMSRVINYLFGEFLSSVNTPFHLMEKFKSVHLYGLDYFYYKKYFDTLNTIAPGDVLEMAMIYLNPEEMTVVSVG